GEHAQRGGLPAPGRPEQHEKLAVGDVQRQPAHGGRIARGELLPDIVVFNLPHDCSISPLRGGDALRTGGARSSRMNRSSLATHCQSPRVLPISPRTMRRRVAKKTAMTGRTYSTPIAATSPYWTSV